MTDKIREQILTIRDSGRTNMFDMNMVQQIAYENATTNWSAASKNTAENTASSF